MNQSTGSEVEEEEEDEELAARMVLGIQGFNQRTHHTCESSYSQEEEQQRGGLHIEI